MTLTIGTPLIDIYGKTGFVAAIKAPAYPVYTLGAGRMDPVGSEVEIVWTDRRISELPDTIAIRYVEPARQAGVEPITADEIETMRADARAATADRAKADADARTRAADAHRVFMAEAAKRLPADCPAVLVAEYVEDRSDTMSDYHGSATLRTVILCASKHTRDLFAEMRKAAALFTETADLADAPEKAEHREKYSMGAGYYLKNGWRDSTGWQVRKLRLYRGIESLPTAEFLPDAPTPTAPEPSTPTPSVSGVRIEEHTHTKKGFQMHVCVLEARVEREEFDSLRDRASARGGWYSRPWGRTPGGFAFKDRQSAEGFAASISAGTTDNAPEQATVAPAPAAPAPRSTATADKLREMADRLQSDIDSKFGNRTTNTPKQRKQAAEARNDGWHLTRAQQAMRALAEAHIAGTVPPVLARVTSKAAILELMRSRIDRSNAGYYDAGVDTGEPASETPQTRALWPMIAGQSDAEREVEELRAKVEGLKGFRLDGYFPTPAAIVAEMVEEAGMGAEPLAVLEPSAGSGAIIDGLREHAPNASVSAFEVAPRLREVLTLKGVDLIGDDFLEVEPTARFDRVLMNPPFEKGQDMEHVRHAHAFLKPGGRLVAIMSPGPFFRFDRKAADFRAWFEGAGGWKRDIPAGTFKESGTGIGTVLVVIEA